MPIGQFHDDYAKRIEKRLLEIREKSRLQGHAIGTHTLGHAFCNRVHYETSGWSIADCEREYATRNITRKGRHAR